MSAAIFTDRANVLLLSSAMADLGTPAAGAMTPNPAAPAGGGKHPLVYICGGIYVNVIGLARSTQFRNKDKKGL